LEPKKRAKKQHEKLPWKVGKKSLRTQQQTNSARFNCTKRTPHRKGLWMGQGKFGEAWRRWGRFSCVHVKGIDKNSDQLEHPAIGSKATSGDPESEKLRSKRIILTKE